MRKAFFHFGNYLLFMKRMLFASEKFRIYWHAILQEVVAQGVGSLPIVGLTAMFIGAVTTIQTSYQLEMGFFPKSIIGYVVSASGLLEMAPTVTSLVLAGKIGSNIASQIGTMRISEQIDAIDVMGVNSASYLILPKVLGGIIAFPLLVIVAAFVIHVGGMLAGEFTHSINYETFTAGVRQYHDPFYVTFMLIKATNFGFIVTSVSSYQGYYVKGGAVEVGQAGTRSVVFSCVFILLADYILAGVLL